MTSPITFTPMNRALDTDSADMPHVLGDPADTGWQGTAERINANFAAIKAWCAQQAGALNAARIPPALATGTAVLTAATNWTAGSGGWAEARSLVFADNVRLVFLNFQLTYTGAPERPTGGLAAQNIATLVAAYRPTVNCYYRKAGAYYTHGTTYADWRIGCDIGILTTGAMAYQVPSALAAPGEAPTQITASLVYFTGSS